MSPTRASLLVALACVGPCLRSSATGAPIYALADHSGEPGYFQFGTFDLLNPSGTQGSYTYAWTNLGDRLFGAAGNLAVQPGTGQMFLTYEFTELRTISAAGTMGPVLGTTTNSFYGMAFQADGSLRAVDVLTSELITANPTSGATTAASGLGFLAYSSYAGNLSAIGNSLYFANYGFSFDEVSTTTGLYRLGPTGLVGEFVGTGFDVDQGLVLFAWDEGLYLLNGNRVYDVDTTNAQLTLLGTVAGLDANFNGFSGAVGNISGSPIPEPSTYGLLLGAAALAAAAIRRRRR